MSTPTPPFLAEPVFPLGVAGDPGAEVRRSNSMIRRETAESDLFIDLRFETLGEGDIVGVAGAPRGDSGAAGTPSPLEAGGVASAEGGAAAGNGLDVERPPARRSEAMAATAGAEA